MPRPRPLVLSLLILWTLLPLLPLAMWSLAGAWRWPQLLPAHWSGRAWAYLLSPSTRALPAMLTSSLLAASTALIALLIGIPAALALARGSLRGQALLELLIVAPFVVPPLAVAMGLQILVLWLGLADSFVGVLLVHVVFAAPYVVLVLLQALTLLGTSWEEQARSLGASPWRAFWHVLLPLLRPALAVAALLAFLTSWSQYALTLLIGGGRIFTLPLLVFAAARGSDSALIAAAALLFVLPTLLAIAVVSRGLRQQGGLERF